MTASVPPRVDAPDVSIVMPCYNEQAIVAFTVTKLCDAFQRAGHRFELVTVDNGSTDRTASVLRDLSERFPAVVTTRVEVNQGYGHGVLHGLPLCRAPWVGIIPADGQVDAEDVVRLYEAALSSDPPVLAKVRRRFRMDGLWRKIVSTTYNVFVRMLWPGIQSVDMNGSPKLMPRALVPALRLQSKGWLLDLEIMIKAHYLGVRVLELNVFARMRNSGTSHVRASTCWEFLRHLLKFRFSRRWREEFQSRPIEAERTAS
jgi:glycosyltransferase involved in cell wall biosynthesis